MADISLLKNQRGRIKGSVTRLKTFADNISEDKTTEDLETRLEKLEELYFEFKQIDDDLSNNNVQSEFEEFESKYFEIKSNLLKVLKQRATPTQFQASNNNNANTAEQLNSTMSRFVEQQRNLFDTVANHSHSDTLEVKLPRVNIPPFTGSYIEWPSFKDLFESTIDSREGLSNVHKLQYLKGLLRGEPASLIKHIAVTDVNYQEAWTKLKLRYDKKRQILTSYIKTFISQPPCTTSSSNSLRKLTDTADELIRGIKMLGDDAKSRDPWLIHILLNKTDLETRHAWAEESAEKEFPSFEEFLTFLNRHCDALESFEPSLKRQPATKPTVRSLHTETTINCPKCNLSHHLSKCQGYKSMDIAAKRNFVSNRNLCFNCLSAGHQVQFCKSKFQCHFCKKLHHSSLHIQDVKASAQIKSHHASTNEDNPDQLMKLSRVSGQPTSSTRMDSYTHQCNLDEEDSSSAALNAYSSYNHIFNKIPILPTAIGLVADATSSWKTCRILLDSGSQASFISEEFAQRLGLKREKAKIIVRGLSSGKSGYTKGKMSLILSSPVDQSQQIRVEAFILNRLTLPQPPRYINIDNCPFWDLIQQYELADPTFNQPSKIDVLLGADHVLHILREGRHVVSPAAPALQNTIFGYIISGQAPQSSQNESVTSLHISIANVDQALRRFWEIEELPIQQPKYSEEEEHCESMFIKTIRVDSITGRYVVRLPFRNNSPALGNTLLLATKQFQTLERRFRTNPELQKEYSDFLEEYRNLKHLESVPPNMLYSNIETFYLPHHAVLKPSSTTTRLRVVFNGSASSSSGISLNDKMLVGPKVQRDLIQILLSFRTHPIAITADIEKMFRQILVDESDRAFQRIVWRKSSDQPLQHYQLTTVTYGTSSVPFLATRSLMQLTEEFKGQYPSAEKALKNNFYVDDYLGGANTLKEAVILKEQLISLLQLRGFSLRKWTSNSREFQNSIPLEHQSFTSLKIDDTPDSIKVLGLKWIPSEDKFAFDITNKLTPPATKRSILSESSKIFDPLGLLSPITISFKILLQQLWLLNYDWDSRVSDTIAEKWSNLWKALHHIKEVRIPRFIGPSSLLELHGFSDASEMAYSAAVYGKVTSDGAAVTITLIAAKTRVAPVKQISLPRLELCGALLLANLITFILSTLSLENTPCFAWTDSEVVLSWLSSHPRKWKCYIGNRTSQILSILPRNCWHHVRSAENPADLATRGISAMDLVRSRLWWRGPEWLEGNWNQQPPAVIKENRLAEQERRNEFIEVFHADVINDTLDTLFQRHSHIMRVIRILSRCLRFILKCKSKALSLPQWITTSELGKAKRVCYKWVQASFFPSEIKCLQTGQQLPTSSRLLSLVPFLDVDGILRVGGRLQNSLINYNAKHPIILPKDHPFIRALIRYKHEMYMHAGLSLLMNILKQDYWILSSRTSIKSCIKTCLKCIRYRAATSKQLMANLPIHRVTPTRAFENVGVDYAGPLSILLHKGRGARCAKGYIAVFVCLSTKALHLEAVTDLTSESFIACLKRFTSKRGLPLNIYSDNGTNFVGANRQLREVFDLVKSHYHNELITNFLSNLKVSWHFNPPSAPQFGGLWEAGVKAVKRHLHRVIGDIRLTFEELATFLSQVDALLNSRPITPITNDINDLDALTPAHFLIGQPLVAQPEAPVEDVRVSTHHRWRHIQQMHQHFWKRWHLEYLNLLQHRPKWRAKSANLEIGNLVLLKEDNMPPSTWLLGRIIDTHPGRDNLVRVATIKTVKGNIKRPISKICKLPIEDS